MTRSEETEVIDSHRLEQLTLSVSRRAPLDAAVLLTRESDEMVAQVLSALPTSLMVRVLASLPESRRTKLANLFDQSDSAWRLNLAHPESSVGRLMEPIEVRLRVSQTVAEAIEAIQPFAKQYADGLRLRAE
ncbi:MAG: hypothetical protein ISP91_15160 [Pseudomonadales bacterium]|jgi:Mg/Co/Ni transporter MgtE|nr:hypothetical protein [Pseudomonadales bacterium]